MPDEYYDPGWMEMDGDYKNIPRELKWKYSEEPSTKKGMHSCVGLGPCLKNFSRDHFNDPLEACTITGGLDRNLMSNLNFISNQHLRGKLTITGNFGGMVWKNLLVKEIYRS